MSSAIRKPCLRFCLAGVDEQGQVVEGTSVDTDTLYLRTVNDGNRARFAWSSDGREFSDFGPEFRLEFGKWTGDRLGFFCWNDDQPLGHLDVDWFQYDYDGPTAK